MTHSIVFILYMQPSFLSDPAVRILTKRCSVQCLQLYVELKLIVQVSLIVVYLQQHKHKWTGKMKRAPCYKTYSQLFSLLLTPFFLTNFFKRVDVHLHEFLHKKYCQTDSIQRYTYC